MDALSLLIDQFRHMAWADALVFSTITGKAGVERDDYILAKLRHLHAVQRIFLDVWFARPLDPRVADDLAVEKLVLFAREVHAASMLFLETLTPVELECVIELPWSKTATEKLGFTVAEHSLAETLVQVPEHSAYHRGQIAARLRELGVDPPMTDYIAWIWRHKPEAAWPCSA
ncbi:MAG: DinB family protein [Chlorobaculum sp.]